MLGEPVARRLRADGYRVRVATRDPAARQRRFGGDYELVETRLSDESSVAAAMTGCYGVHISLPTGVELESTQSISRLAPEQGVGRLTYISGPTVSEEARRYRLGDIKYRCEQAVRGSGLPYTIFRCTMFNETLPIFVKGDRVLDIGPLRNKWHWLAAEDYARMVSRSYGVDEAEGKTLVVRGPEALTIGEALEKYVAEYHPEVTRTSTTPTWVFRVLGLIKRSPELTAVADMFHYFKEAGEVGDPSEANSLLGAPETTVDEWLETRKAMAARPDGTPRT